MIIRYITDGTDYEYHDNHGVLIRCKDCNEYQDVNQWCKLHELEMQPMDFCSYGERENAVD